jgi:hypothetical protein
MALGRTEQSRAEQSRAEQSRAEQSRAERGPAVHRTLLLTLPALARKTRPSIIWLTLSVDSGPGTLGKVPRVSSILPAASEYHRLIADFRSP